MKVLLRKELAPFLAPACVLAVLFTCLLCWAVDADEEPPGALFLLVLLLSVNAGALIGYVQLASERDGDTLAYLQHRERAPRSLILAKCLAGWVLMALVVHLPLVLFAFLDPGYSPYGPVARLGNVGVLLLVGLAGVPAQALGLFCATLPLAAPARRILLLLAAQPWTGWSALLLSPRWTTGVIVTGVSFAGFSVWLAGSACARLKLIEDPERSQPPARLLSELALLILLLVVPGHLLLSGLQFKAVESAVRDRPSIAWHRDRGPGLLDRDQTQWRVSYPDGTTTLVADVVWSWAQLGLEREGWIHVWRPHGIGSSESKPMAVRLQSAGGLQRAPVYAQAEGDIFASTVWVVDAATGETVMVQRYSLEGMGQVTAAAFAFGSSLLFAPAEC